MLGSGRAPAKIDYAVERVAEAAHMGFAVLHQVVVRMDLEVEA